MHGNEGIEKRAGLCAAHAVQHGDSMKQSSVRGQRKVQACSRGHPPAAGGAAHDAIKSPM